MSKYVPLRIRGGSVAWSIPQASVVLIDSGLPEPLSYVKVSWLYVSAGAVLTRLVIETDGSISYKAISGAESSLILSATGNFLGSTTKTTGDYYIDVSSGDLISIP